MGLALILWSILQGILNIIGWIIKNPEGWLIIILFIFFIKYLFGKLKKDKPKAIKA